jgi:hypothetical protein
MFRRIRRFGFANFLQVAATSIAVNDVETIDDEEDLCYTFAVITDDGGHCCVAVSKGRSLGPISIPVIDGALGCECLEFLSEPCLGLCDPLGKVFLVRGLD